jgi:hypothetical protein
MLKTTANCLNEFTNNKFTYFFENRLTYLKLNDYKEVRMI